MMILPVFAICAIFQQASGHGKLMEPPGRSSAWRVGFPTPKNYDDNALFCGGFSTQVSNGGKCGVCGDPWNGRRENEAGGKYATGTIVRKYKMGQTINVKVDITANHWGWMEFRICPNNDVTKAVTHECLNKHVLQRADGKGTKILVSTRRTGIWAGNYKLPDGMTCSQCVIQWKYHAGNSDGVDAKTGERCHGCGPQEEFYGCADVSIEGNGGGLPRPQTPRPTPPPTERVTQPQVVETELPIFIRPQVTDRVQTTRPPKPTPQEFIGVKLPCRGTNNWANVPYMDKWCTDMCTAGNCPSIGCDCSEGQKVMTEKVVTSPTTQRRTTTPKRTTTSPTTTTKTELVSRFECKGINFWAGDPALDKWCTDTCARGDCPSSACKCTEEQKTGQNPSGIGLEPVTQKPYRPVTERPVEPETERPEVHVTDAPFGKITKICKLQKYAIGALGYDDEWCTEQCNKGNCPGNICECTEETIKQATTIKNPEMTSLGRCTSMATVGKSTWDAWCQGNCDRGFCAKTMCHCNV